MGKLNELWQSISTFIKEIWIELKKVSWPTRKETTGQTYAVIVTVFIIAFFLGFVDWVFRYLFIEKLLR